MFYLCVLILCLFQNRSFSIREQSSKLLRPRPLHWGVHTCPPLKFTRKLSEKILVSRYGNFNEEVFFHVFFFYTLQVFYKKSPLKNDVFRKLWISLVRGGKKTVQLPGWVPLFFTFKRDHMLQWNLRADPGDFPTERWTATRKMRIPNVTVGGAGMQQFFFFFSEDVLVLYGFILFWLGTGKTTKNNLKQNVTYLEQLEKDT